MCEGILFAWKYVNDTQKAQKIVKKTFLLTKAYCTVSLHFFILTSNTLDPVLYFQINKMPLHTFVTVWIFFEKQNWVQNITV